MTLCAHCGTREGTIQWGDVLALTHGMAQVWCEVCALEKQIEHAEERRAALPELEARYAVLTFRDPSEYGEWDKTSHRFMEKPGKHEGEQGYDGDPESCGLCHFTAGNPIHLGRTS